MKIRITIVILFLCLILFSCSEDKSETHLDEKPSTKTIQNKVTEKLFTKLLDVQTNIDFINHNIESNDFNFYHYEYFYNGGGVAFLDINNDDLQDIIFTGNMSPNRVFLNKGNFKFEDLTNTSNLNSGKKDWSTGVNIIDINNDGFDDVFISRSGWWKGKDESKLRNLLYINNGDLTFTEKGIEYGLKDLSRSTHSCFFDKDNDGDLDLYIINHPRDFAHFRTTGLGQVLSSPENYEYSNCDKLYENRNGKYIDVTKKEGLENAAFGLGIASADVNNDGWQDLIIGNDYSQPDYLYINNKKGSFEDMSHQALKHMSQSSMGLDVADVDNDGDLDIFNTEMLAKDNFSKKANMASMNPELYQKYIDNGLHYQNMHNTLQLNNGNGTFSEIAWLSGVAESGWSWAPLFADFNNDGFKDLFISNGYKRDVLNKDFKNKDFKTNEEGLVMFKDLESSIPSSKLSNYIYSNNGDLIFEDKTLEWGLNEPLNSNGAAYADLDNDGDLDLVINNINELASIYRNNSKGNNYINFELKNGNKVPYGSRVEILDEGSYQMLELTNVHGYQSKCEDKLHFGLGKKASIEKVLITWADGKRTLLENIDINKLHKINYSAAQFTDFKYQKESKKYFVDKTREIALKYVHKEKDFDDYKREILLPHKLSQEGPFIDVADVNGDGLEDFYVGNGTGFTGELYVQTKTGSFQKTNQASIAKDYMSEDLGVLFLDYDKDGDQDLYVVSGSNEAELSSIQMQDRLYENDGKGNFTKTNGTIPQIQSSGSCVVSADFDADGDLDLLVGGFQIPGQYPKAGKTSLLENKDGKFVDITKEKAKGLENIGMVKDAAFADINKDGKLDIIVTGHWMPIEILINENNSFVNKSKEYGTITKVGWFNKLLLEDVNQDGYIDIIAGNLGTNTKHKASQNEPFKIYADDFDGNGTNDIVLGYYNEGICYPVRGKQCSSEQIPSISKKIPTYDQFGMSDIFQIYGKENLDKSTHYDATFFESAIYKNQAGKDFTIEALPNECQFAPTNGIVALDIDGDQKKEIVMVGNHHPIEVETGRYDAHIGNLISIANNKATNLKDTGFFVDSDARSIKQIKIGTKNFLVVASNRSKLQFFELK